MSEKRFGWDCPYKDNRDFCTALLKPQICCPSICCFGLSDEIDEQQDTRMCAWFEDLLNELNDERMMYKTTIDKRIVELEEENVTLKKKLKTLQKVLHIVECVSDE